LVADAARVLGVPVQDPTILAEAVAAPEVVSSGRTSQEEEDEGEEVHERQQQRQEQQEQQPQQQQPQQQQPSPATAFVEHVIMPEDTLFGILLRYNVSKRELKRWNDFPGESFHCLDVLRVPIGKPDQLEADMQDPSSRQIILQRFKTSTRLGEKEALYYLDENGWHLEAAVAQFRADDEWAKRARKRA